MMRAPLKPLLGHLVPLIEDLRYASCCSTKSEPAQCTSHMMSHVMCHLMSYMSHVVTMKDPLYCRE